MVDKRVELGVIIGAHGVRGDVIIKPFGHDPMLLDGYGPLTDETGTRTFTLQNLKPHKKGVSAAIKEVNNRDDAEALRGTVLFVLRSNLPPPGEDEFYYSDLLGLEARLTTGEKLGEITAIDDYGAGDIIEILPQNSQSTVHVSFTSENVPEVNISEGYIVVIPPDYDTDET